MLMQNAARSSVAAGLIGAVGDVLMQCIAEHRRSSSALGLTIPAELDTARTARLATYRFFHAPFIDAAWRAFDARVTFGGARAVLTKIALDQSLLMPPSLAIFFYSQGLMEGCDHGQCLARARDSLLPAAAVCLPYWCLVHLVTFSAVPTNMRIAWTAFAAVGWNAFMSDANQRAVQRVGCAHGPGQRT